MAVEGTQGLRCSVRDASWELTILHLVTGLPLEKTEGMDRETAMEERTLCWTEAGRRR